MVSGEVMIRIFLGPRTKPELKFPLGRHGLPLTTLPLATHY
jgi:hypothetical protein